MFFLSIDNQIQFLLLTLMPTYLVFSALTWDHTDSPKRVFGLLYIAPLLLSLFSFLNAPVHREMAVFLLFAAGISTVLLLTIAEFAARSITASHATSLLSLLAPLPFFLIRGIVPLPILLEWTFPIMSTCILIQIALWIQAILHKCQADMLRLSGSILTSIGLLLFHLDISRAITSGSHVLVAIGLLLGCLTLYRSTFANLQQIVRTQERTLNRINNNLQQEVNKRVASIERSNRVLLERSRTDTLTGLYAKAAIAAHAEMLMHRNPDDPLSLVMLDIDHFKGLNDRLGHPVGDRCLKALAGIARASFRSNDVLGRYGGDEFIFLLPDTTSEMARTVADRFRNNIEVGSNPKFTVSVGIATFPVNGNHVKALIEKADEALYHSKTGGRNRVTHISHPDEPES